MRFCTGNWAVDIRWDTGAKLGLGTNSGRGKGSARVSEDVGGDVHDAGVNRRKFRAVRTFDSRVTERFRIKMPQTGEGR
jgi:hypothetical protein